LWITLETLLALKLSNTNAGGKHLSEQAVVVRSNNSFKPTPLRGAA